MMVNRSRISFLQSVYPWLTVACGMLFYCYNYFLRVSPGVMKDELTQAFHITATEFGTLAGLYYLAYTPMQIPAGMLYDKFGVRFVLCIASLIAVAGLSVFIASNNFYLAGLGRLLIGLGCAFAYIGTLKLASNWLPANRFATAAGLTTAIGMTAGALSQKYLTKVIENIGYQQALHGALMIGILLSIMIIVLVRSRPKTEVNTDNPQVPMNIQQLWSAVIYIVSNPQMWLIGSIGCLLYLPSSVFLDLWGVPYLKTVYQLSTREAVSVLNYTFYGWIISGPAIGMVSDKIKRRRLPLTSTGFFAAVLLGLVFYFPFFATNSLHLIFFMIGFCCGAHPLCFALGKESNPIHFSATAVAVTNMLIMAGGAVFQPVVGKLLDYHTTSPLGADGLPVYAANDYTFALSVIPIGVAFGIFLSLFVKETYCESQVAENEDLIFTRRANETS